MKRSELVFGRLKGQKLTELRLPTRPLEKDNQIASDGQRHRSAQIFLDQRQGEVNACSHPGRGPNRVVLHENGIGVDMDGRKTPGKFCAESPVRDRSSAVKQTRCGEQKSSGTH